MIIILIMTWPDDYSLMTDARRTARDTWIALASRYDCRLVRWDTWLEAVVGTGYGDSDVEAFLSGVGNVHPDDDGHEQAALALQDSINTSGLDFNQWTSALTDYAYYFDGEAADFEHDPIIRVGTDNDGETGTWSTSGTARTSNVAESTISWSGTFCSFGLESNVGVGAGQIQWQLDDGDWHTLTLSLLGATINAVGNFERGAHTVTLKVVSGTVTINRFLAI